MSKAFRFWCQKVLPLVYDDSLSYYELLCKVVDYLNKEMEDITSIVSDVSNLQTQYLQLKNYVDTYFTNLDVQDEINTKLDDLVENGSLAEIVSAYFGNKKVQPSASPEVVQMIYDNARTYLSNKGKMCYMHLYDDGGNNNATNYVNGAQIATNPRTGHRGYPMNCSALTMLLMWGVDYYHSMMTPEYQLNNLLGSAGYIFNPYGADLTPDNYTDIRTSYQQAAWFNKNGLLQRVNSDFSNVLPGDIVFFQNMETYPIVGVDKIHHCGMVLSQLTHGSLSKFIYIDYRENDNADAELAFHDFNINLSSNINLMPVYVGRPVYTATACVKPRKLGDFTQSTVSNLFTLPSTYKDHLFTALIKYNDDAGLIPQVRINGTRYSQYDLPKISTTEANTNRYGVTTFKTYPGTDNITLQFYNCKNVTLFDGVLADRVIDSFYATTIEDLIQFAKSLSPVVANNSTDMHFDAFVNISDVVSANTYKCHAVFGTSKTTGYISLHNGNNEYMILVNGDDVSILNNKTAYHIDSIESEYSETYRTVITDATLDSYTCTVIHGVSFMVFITSNDIIHVNKKNGTVSHLIQS